MSNHTTVPAPDGNGRQGRPLPSFSIIIPVRDAEATVDRCLEAVFSSRYPPELFEVICVDDGSCDSSVAIIGKYPCKLLHNKRSKGAATARNQAAREARRDILLFIDADAIIRENTIALFAECFSDPSAQSAIGSHDFNTPYRHLASLYKNLYVYRHFLLQGRETRTFYTCIGAVRKDVFWRVGGFDESFVGASVEDYDLGLRLTSSGSLTRIVAGAAVDHLKEMNLFSLVRIDYWRAYGQARISLKHRHTRRRPDETGHRLPLALALCLLCAGGTVSLLAVSLISRHPLSWLATGALFLGFVITEVPLLSLIGKRAGPLSALAALPTAFIDSLASIVGVSFGILSHLLGRGAGRKEP